MKANNKILGSLKCIYTLFRISLVAYFCLRLNKSSALKCVDAIKVLCRK